MIPTILATIIALGVLVTVHEFGHYWVAKRCGVRVLRFSVGFGRALYTIGARAHHITVRSRTSPHVEREGMSS